MESPAHGLSPSTGLSRKATVSVVRCPDYGGAELAAALRQSLERLAGPAAFIRPGSRVFVKINHLSSSAPPEKAVVTHPLFVREVLRLFLDCGARLTVGDDIDTSQGDGFSKSGIRRVCAELGARLVSLRETGFSPVTLEDSISEKIYLAREVLEADFVLNLPKLKTHSFTVFTGAVKNMFGVIPHGLRLDFHRRFIRSDIFSRALVDVFAAARPGLTVMDAVVAMEGEGPSSGAPKKTGLILAGADGVAVDAVAGLIVGLSPSAVVTTSDAHRRGLGVGDPQLIEIVGEELTAVAVKGFRHSAAAVALFRGWLPAWIYAYVSGQLQLTPQVMAPRCRACGECLKICPARTIRLVQDQVRVDEASCIHCLCCHEVCPHQALRLKQRPVGRAVRTAEALYKKISAILASR
jgi:uncharacterized protein (DUF362 family)/Pyruvate/2-oxoacid:ferredoxin oxidoreductase delta subunit